MDDKRHTYSEYNTLNNAALYAAGADIATVTHGVAALPIAHHILTHEHPSLLELSMHASASALDLVDGRTKNKAVRLASKVLFGVERDLRDPENRPSNLEKEALASYGIVDRPAWDERVDKGYFYAIAGALLARAVKNGHHATAGALGINLAVITMRDTVKTIERKEASKHDISVHATSTGKEKTKLQSVGVGILCSPLGRLASGRALGVGVLTYSTGLGIQDLRSYRRFVRHEKARKGKQIGLIV
jgi:hypothetical protein